MQFTKQDVWDAWSAKVTQDYAIANDISPEELAGTSFSGKVDTTEIERYKRGAAILEQVTLVIGRRYQRFSSPGRFGLDPDDLDSPVIKVFAGHIATTEACREVGLKSK